MALDLASVKARQAISSVADLIRDRNVLIAEVERLDQEAKGLASALAKERIEASHSALLIRQLCIGAKRAEIYRAGWRPVDGCITGDELDKALVDLDRLRLDWRKGVP
jgi:hypothetical protein